MGRYVARRLGQLVIVVLGATLVLFACLFVSRVTRSVRSRAATRHAIPP